ncbi:uncharacterized protein EV154DRAFT_136337 [Mucor mucedo]|uniref:uncharacterized protein n=1 Tax=Mucor mucedo TaxID=29922 RepID=UPI00221EF064|nr:uncharacterized protein EV154DRAFT_136337 [Mucor mucedo]KAI7868367.1 hypothetical protein EV154DRAFT_136337 [Mucor mucedo]
MSDNVVCPKEYAHYKLLPSSIKTKDLSWDFFQKVNAKQWDFESYKAHQNIVSKTQKNFNTLIHEYKNCLQRIIQKNLVPSTLLDYVKELKNTSCVKDNQNLNKEDATLSVVSSGTTIFNNINSGQEQINNIHIRKRRKLRPSKNTSKEVHGDKSLVSNDDDDIDDDSNNLLPEGNDDSNSLIPDGNDEDQNVSSSEKTDQDDSFDSVDHHPNAVNYYDYLVGDGQEQWSFSTKAAATLIHQGLNITKLLQEYREASVVAAKHLINISDCRILSLSFIFPFSNQNMQKSFTQSFKQHHHIIKDYIKPLILQPVPDTIILWCNRLDNSFDLNDDSQLNQATKEMKEKFATKISEAEDIHFSIIQRIVKEIRSWNSHNTEDDFMAYLYFLLMKYFRSPGAHI